MNKEQKAAAYQQVRELLDKILTGKSSGDCAEFIEFVVDELHTLHDAYSHDAAALTDDPVDLTTEERNRMAEVRASLRRNRGGEPL